jgi:serpin B
LAETQRQELEASGPRFAFAVEQQYLERALFDKAASLLMVYTEGPLSRFCYTRAVRSPFPIARGLEMKPTLMRRRTFASLLFLSFWSATFAFAGSDGRTLVQGNTQFACDLYQRLSAGEGNVFFSPYSISRCLAMTYAGARGNTETQMATTLHFTLGQEDLHPAFGELESSLNSLQDSSRIALASANSLWPQPEYPVRSEYLRLVGQYYTDTIHYVDYRVGNGEDARGKINGWVAEQTKGKILDLIPKGKITPKTRVTLVNAIYFKGTWEKTFEKKQTKDAPFFVNANKTVQSPLMFQQAYFSYGEDDRIQILEMPYAGKELSMVVILPPKEMPLSEVEKTLTASALDRWLGKLRAVRAASEVFVYLPKFKTTLGFSLRSTLSEMGIHDAFDPQLADFNGMVDMQALSSQEERFSISDVIHKAFVDVSEEGTEAAAATAVIGGGSDRAYHEYVPPPVFRADHPFIFLIREKQTGSILFMGRVVDPTVKGM